MKNTNEYNYSLGIEGMRCGGCETHINDVIRRNFNVKKVKSSHRKNLTIIKSNEEIGLDRLTSLITELGYKVTYARKL